MSIMIGGKEPTAIKVGTQDVKAVYAGAKKVWPKESNATVLKLKAIKQSSDAPTPIEVTDKTDSPQWRFWMDVEKIEFIAYTEMIVEEIPADAEIKFVLVGNGGLGRGSTSYGVWGWWRRRSVFSMPRQRFWFKSGDKFRVGRLARD